MPDEPRSELDRDGCLRMAYEELERWPHPIPRSGYCIGNLDLYSIDTPLRVEMDRDGLVRVLTRSTQLLLTLLDFLPVVLASLKGL